MRKLIKQIHPVIQIRTTYDNNKRLTRIYSSSPLAAVNYTYKENSEVSYTYSTDCLLYTSRCV